MQASTVLVTWMTPLGDKEYARFSGLWRGPQRRQACSVRRALLAALPQHEDGEERVHRQRLLCQQLPDLGDGVGRPGGRARLPRGGGGWTGRRAVLSNSNSSHHVMHTPMDHTTMAHVGKLSKKLGWSLKGGKNVPTHLINKMCNTFS